MRWLALAGFAAAGCLSFNPGGGSSSGIDAAPDSPPESTIFRKAITIAPGAVAESLVDFPLFVAISRDSDLATRVTSDASNLRFVAADGATDLDREIERWDPAAGDLTAWVRMPAIEPDAGTTLYLVYGEIGDPPAVDPVKVWSAGFLAVFHMDGDPADPIVDSVGQRPGAAHPTMDASDLVSTPLGRGLDFDGNDDVVTFDNPITGTSAHTISAWVSQRVTNNNDTLLVLGAGGSNDEARFIHTRFDSGTILAGFFSDDFETSADIQGKGFTLLHWTYDTSGVSRVYVNGALVDGPFTHSGTDNTQGDQARIGNVEGNLFGMNLGLDGVIDEVRIADVPRSAAWVAAEYSNQSAPASFYTVGAEERSP